MAEKKKGYFNFLKSNKDSDKSDRNILLVGTEGRGKSSAGNSILGEDRFRVSDSSARSEQGTVRKESVQTGHFKITVVDGLTLQDERMDKAKARSAAIDSLNACFDHCPEGFDLLVIVLRHDMPVTEEEQIAVEAFKTMYCEDWLGHCVVIFTHGETFNMEGKKSFEKWCGEIGNNLLSKLLRDSGSKPLLFGKMNQTMTQTFQKHFLEILQQTPAGCRLQRRIPELQPSVARTALKREEPPSLVDSGANQGKQIVPVPSPYNINVFLVGSAGQGNSSTGNALLGRNVFGVSGIGVPDKTTSPNVACNTVDRISITVFDGPGRLDTREAEEKMTDGFNHCPGGVKAFLLVISLAENRFTSEQSTHVSNLEKFFGKKFVKDHCILVFTHVDSYKKKKLLKWLQKPTEDFGDLIAKCNQRFILFSSKTREQTQEAQQQLIQLAQSMPIYTKEMLPRMSVSQRSKVATTAELRVKDIYEKLRSIVEHIDVFKEHPDLNRNKIEDFMKVVESLITDICEAKKALESVNVVTTRILTISSALLEIKKTESADTGEVASALKGMYDQEQKSLQNYMNAMQFIIDN